MAVWSVGWGRTCLLRNLPPRERKRCGGTGSRAQGQKKLLFGGLRALERIQRLKGRIGGRVQYQSKENGEKLPEEAGGRRRVGQQRKEGWVSGSAACPLGRRAKGGDCDPALAAALQSHLYVRNQTLGMLRPEMCVFFVVFMCYPPLLVIDLALGTGLLTCLSSPRVVFHSPLIPCHLIPQTFAPYHPSLREP